MNKYLNVNGNFYDNSYINPEDVMLSEDRKSITIINCDRGFDYTITNSITGDQAAQWINGAEKTIVFPDLDPKIKYAVRIKRSESMPPLPVVKPEIIPIHTIPLEGADIIVPTGDPSFDIATGCGVITIKADPNHGYAVLNEKNMPLTEREIKKWNIKVTDDKGYLLPKTTDGYYFGCKTKIRFQVPAGGSYKLGGKNMKNKYTFINGPLFNTPGIFYNAWYVYVPAYEYGRKGSYNFVIHPACKGTMYKLLNNEGKVQMTLMTKGNQDRLFFTAIVPEAGYAVGEPIPLDD